MQKLKYYMNIFFSSYTAASLAIALLNMAFGKASDDVSAIWVFQMALLCLAITALMFVTDLISEKLFGNIPDFAFILVGVTEVSVCVMLMGGLWYKWFPLSMEWILIVLAIDTVIYFCVFGVMFFQEKKFAENINKIIKSRRDKDGKNH